MKKFFAVVGIMLAVVFYRKATSPEFSAFLVIKEDLKSPDSATEVENKIVSTGDWNGNGKTEYIVFITLDAKNSFNATVRNSYLVWLENDGSDFRHYTGNQKYMQVSNMPTQYSVDLYKTVLGINDRSPASL